MRTQPARFLRIFLFFAFASLLPLRLSAQTAPAPTRITQAVDEAQLTVLKGNTYPLARAEYDRGPAPASLPMNRMLLILRRSSEQEAALEQFLDQQQDPASPNYHQWLTPQQFGQQFGPADQDVQTITSWLQSHGFQVTRTSNGRTVIEFSGTAGQVQEALHTTIHQYAVPGANGIENHWANSSDPQIPTALTPVVVGVDTLHNFPRKAMHVVAGVFKKDKSTGQIKAANPEFTFTCGTNNQNQPLSCYGLGPYDFATIYNVLPLWNGSPAPVIDGTGQTIGIIGETDVDMKDLAAFRNLFGLPPNPPVVVLDGPDPGVVPGDETESDLDLQWSAGVAKGATIKFIISATTNTTLGVDLSAQYAVDNNLAAILSESYGICEAALGTAGNQFYNAVWQQAAAEGITAFVSAGDNGSAGCDNHDAPSPAPAEFGLQVSGFASTPYNVAVGGTDFNDLSNPTTYWNTTNTSSTTQLSAKSYIPEVPWNDSCTSAALTFFGYPTNALTNCNDTKLLQVNVFTLGGSGGKSSCTTGDGQDITSCAGGYAKPSWQTGTGVPSDGKRDIPDVSLFAATGFYTNSFYIVCAADQTGGAYCDQDPQNLEFLGIGGTSASSPAFAGIMAMVDQKAGARQGNANYILYQLAAKSGNSCTSSGTPASTCVFYDVTTGTNAMPCDDTVTKPVNCGSPGAEGIGILSGYNSTTGYDLTTGLGSVNAANLVNTWSTITSALKPTATTLSLNPTSSIVHGSAVTVQINVTPTPPATGTATGNVALMATSTIDPGVTDFALTNGSVSSTTDELPGGTYNVTAHYPGDGTFSASDSAPVAVTVTPEASKTFVNLVTLDANGNTTSFSASSATYGSGSFLLRVDVGDSGASVSPSTGISSNCSKHLENCPTGAVALTSNGSPLDGGSLALNSGAYAEDQALPTGTYAVSASYAGDPSYRPSTTTANFTIAKAPTTASASVAGLPVQYGNNEQVSAGLQTTSNGVEPTGTFTFSLDGSPLTTTALVYEGFPYEPNSSPPSFATLDATGDAVFLTIGSHALTTQYSGDSNYAAATSSPSTFTVAQAQPSFETYGASPASITLGQQVTLSAQMFGSDRGVPPTGTMTFRDGNTAISGTVTYTAISSTTLTGSALQATLPYTPTSGGTHAITVSYSGDTNYLPATSPTSATLTVIGPVFAVTASPSSVPISAPGATGSTMITFAGMNGYSGTIPLSPALCAGMPSETTCSFSASSAVLNSTTTTAQVMVTFQTTAASGGLPQVVTPTPTLDRWSFGGILALACSLCALILSARRGVVSRSRWSMVCAVLAIASLAAIASCGGGGGGSGPTNPGTPVGVDQNVVITFSGAGVTPNPTLNLSINVE